MSRRSTYIRAISVFALGSLFGAASAQINVASQANGGVASQSSTWTGAATADRANDGNRNGMWNNGSVSHTNSEFQAWWQVQLDSVYTLGEILVWNRTDSLGERINPFRVQVFNGASLVWESTNNTFVDDVNDGDPETAGMRFAVPSAIGDRVRIRLENANYLHMAEVEAYTAVPEPATIAALSLGALAMMKRRHKS